MVRAENLPIKIAAIKEIMKPSFRGCRGDWGVTLEAKGELAINARDANASRDI